MFSKIGDYLRPAATARDTQHVQATRDREKNQREGGHAGAETAADDMLFSIDAIRALLTTMTLPPEQAAQLEGILKGLASLDALGIKNIPVRLGQSIYEAVTDALRADKT